MIILIPNPWQFKKLIIHLIILFAPLPLFTPHFLFSPKPCGRALADGLLRTGSRGRALADGLSQMRSRERALRTSQKERESGRLYYI